MESPVPDILLGGPAKDAVTASRSNSSSWWEVGLVCSTDARSNTSPTYDLGTEKPVCTG